MTNIHRQTKNIEAIILAGGKGTRMKSDIPKVLIDIAGQPLLSHIIQTLGKVGIQRTSIVIPQESEKVITTTLAEHIPAEMTVEYVYQPPQPGTAMAAKAGVQNTTEECETVLVVFGDDSALYQPDTVESILKSHHKSNNQITVTTFELDTPTPVGGLRINNEGNVTGVIIPEEMIQEGITKNIVMPGLICINKTWFQKTIDKLEINPYRNEYTLPSIFEIAHKEGTKVATFKLTDERQWNSVNTQAELEETRGKKLQQCL